MPRSKTATLALLSIGCANAQFAALSTNHDGSRLYFTSTLRLKGTDEPLNGKVFSSSADGVSLFRARQSEPIAAGSLPCAAGGFRDYVAAETGANGAIALVYNADTPGGCSYPVYTYSTHVQAADREFNVQQGVVRLSPDGRQAIVYSPVTGRMFNGVKVSFLDLQSGMQIPVEINTPAFPVSVLVPTSGGRVIANDGTAIVAFSDRGYLVKAGEPAKPFPAADGVPLIIDAAGSKVVYSQAGAVYALDLQSQASTLLIPDGQQASGFQMSDDARTLLFLHNGQAAALDMATLSTRVLTATNTTVTAAAISGDGSVVYAATDVGGLLKIDTRNGTVAPLIGRTPYLSGTYGRIIPGLAPTFNGSGLSGATIDGTPPFHPWLGQLTMWMGERKIPVISLAPHSVRVLIPWDAPAGTARFLAEVAGESTPFDYPQFEASVGTSRPQAGAIARQDWQQTYVGPIRTGEIIHVWAIGLGPVSPEVPAGAAAPSSEPLARVSEPLTCSNSEILYAGLAPGAVERVYQIDMRMGPTPGYQVFTCRLGVADPFVFLTLNIVEP